MSMIRRLFALLALLFYGSIDRAAAMLSDDDADYPDSDDALASPPRLVA